MHTAPFTHSTSVSKLNSSNNVGIVRCLDVSDDQCSQRTTHTCVSCIDLPALTGTCRCDVAAMLQARRVRQSSLQAGIYLSMNPTPTSLHSPSANDLLNLRHVGKSTGRYCILASPGTQVTTPQQPCPSRKPLPLGYRYTRCCEGTGQCQCEELAEKEHGIGWCKGGGVWSLLGDAPPREEEVRRSTIPIVSALRRRAEPLELWMVEPRGNWCSSVLLSNS
jgi:hypothetical protein